MTASLSSAFSVYLTSKAARAAAKLMSECLRANILPPEADAISFYGTTGQGWISAFDPGTGRSSRCYVGVVPLTNAEPGTIWFDVVEIVPMILIPGRSQRNPGTWLSLRPVQIWQYVAVAGLMKASPEDRKEIGLSVNQFTDPNACDVVTQISNSEAYTYARWFGKSLGGDTTAFAANHLTGAEIEHILPQHLKSWNAGQANSAWFQASGWDDPS